MYEIDLSTLMLIGIDNNTTKIVTSEDEFSVNLCSKDIINNSCKFFGSTLTDRIKCTKILTNISSKAPIIIEESRDLIFFPLMSTREKNNVWISFNNIKSYEKIDNGTLIIFNCGKEILCDFSYYIVDNQVTRSMILDYQLKYRKDSLKN